MKNEVPINDYTRALNVAASLRERAYLADKGRPITEQSAYNLRLDALAIERIVNRCKTYEESSGIR